MTCRVLLVEDEVVVALMVEDLLLESGCEPVVAITGGEALALIAQGPAFSLAIVDLNIPEVDGATVIRALWDRGPVPVIISTGYHDLPHDVREALLPLAAPVETISKPWGEAQFLNLVRRFLPQPQRVAT
jgi:CheY-like chemotaxis protein